MSTIYIDSSTEVETRQLVQSAIEAEVARLELALEVARKRLIPFEEKYGVSSEEFVSRMAAEDLNGGDEEYVTWAGEYRLMQRLAEKLAQLRDIKYGDPELLHGNQGLS